MTTNLALVYIHIRHSSFSFAHHFFIYWLFQNGENKNQHQESWKRIKPYLIKSYFFFFKIGKAKNVRVSKIHVCMWVRCVLWLKNVKSRSRIALFSNERHFEIWFPKKKTITFFWSKLSKLHKKDPILHVKTTFSLKQGETRTSSGPIRPGRAIRHPLKEG